VACERRREGIPGEVGVFLLAQGRERIEPLQFGVDEAGMTHHHAAVGQPLEEPREQRRKVRRIIELIGAGETRIGAQA
jgi:hypothetical protein